MEPRKWYRYRVLDIYLCGIDSKHYKKVHTTDITADIYLASNTLPEFIFVDKTDLIKMYSKNNTHLEMVFKAVQ